MIPQVSFLSEFHAAFTIERFLFVMNRAMPHHLPFHRERFTANFTSESFDSSVRGFVMGQPLPAPEVFPAVRAFVGLVIRVHAIVNVNGVQGAEHFRAMLARVRPFAGMDPSVIVFRSFVRERATANVASVLLQPFVNVSNMPGEILLDAIRFSAQIALARPLVRMNSDMAQKSALGEYNFLTSVALVRHAIVDYLLRFIHELGFVRILDSIHVGMSVNMLLQLRFLAEVSLAQIARVTRRFRKIRGNTFHVIFDLLLRFVCVLESFTGRFVAISMHGRDVLLEILLLTVVH